MVVDENQWGNFDWHLWIQNNNWTGFYEKIRDRINSLEDSRCVLISDCIKLVTQGSRNVFIDGYAYQLDAIKEDFQKTGKCNLQLAGDTYSSLLVAMVLPKRSPYTDPINKGILELREGGFIDYWDLWFRPMPEQCIENFKRGGFKSPRSRKYPSLSFKNLSGAFLLFLVGTSLSVLAFLCEHIISMTGRLRLCRRN